MDLTGRVVRAQANEAHRYVPLVAGRRAFVRVLNEDMLNSRGGHHATAGRELWEKLPAFAYDPPPAGAARQAAQPGLLVLALWAAGAWAALLLAAPRLKPS